MGFVGENFSDEMSTYDDTILHVAMQKIVFSRTLKRAEWNNSEVLREIDLEVITRLKQQTASTFNDIKEKGTLKLVSARPFNSGVVVMIYQL